MADTMIIWAANIDAERSRTRGRKIAKGLAVKKPDLKELSKASHSLGLQCTREKDKLFPKDRAILEPPLDGRITITKKYTKSKTLKLLADEVRRMRSKN